MLILNVVHFLDVHISTDICVFVLLSHKVHVNELTDRLGLVESPCRNLFILLTTSVFTVYCVNNIVCIYVLLRLSSRCVCSHCGPVMSNVFSYTTEHMTYHMHLPVGFTFVFNIHLAYYHTHSYACTVDCIGLCGRDIKC